MPFSYKKSQNLFLISSAEYNPPNTQFYIVENSISIHLTRNYLEYLSQWNQIFYAFFWFTRWLWWFSWELISKSAIILSYYHYWYSWFDRVNLLLILTIWSLSLGLVLSTLFLIWCSDRLESLIRKLEKWRVLLWNFHSSFWIFQ